jgi:tRNA(Arg) A34 adenosine deaminase TadA
MSKIDKYFSIAKKEAKKAKNEDYKHGAVLVKGGSIISVSHNVSIPSKFADRYKIHGGIATRHAEINCVLGLDKKVTSGAVLFVVRVSRGGNLRLSKPCPMCRSVLEYVGVKKVYYSIDNDEYGVIRL